MVTAFLFGVLSVWFDTDLCPSACDRGHATRFFMACLCSALVHIPSWFRPLIPPRFCGTADLPLLLSPAQNKIGDRSNASSEVEYHNAYGELLGREGKGISVILEMVQNTR